MPKVDSYNFNYKELAKLLIKAADVKEGYWGVRVSFKMQATNIGSSPEKKDLIPGAVILIDNIGLQRFPDENSLSVDAATVWSSKED